MEEGKVLCPHCKGQKTETFSIDNISTKRTCLTCDDNGMVWWIDVIINPQGYPWGYIREVSTQIQTGRVIETATGNTNFTQVFNFSNRKRTTYCQVGKEKI